MRHIRLIAAACTLIALTACGSNTTDTAASASAGEDAARTTAPSSPAPSPSAARAEEQGQSPAATTLAEALQFSAKTVDGETFDAATLAGRDSVLWFWAPWCSECRREAPLVAEAQSRLGDAVEFVGVAGLGPVDDMQAFIDQMDVGAFPHIADLDGAMWQRFGVVQQPAYAFINQNGHVKVVIGELGEQRLNEQLAALTSD